MLSQQPETFHIVCHDCEFERLTTDVEEARRLSDAHVEAQNHQTRYARIQ